MSINSRQKGAGAEREFAGLVNDWSGVRLIRNLEQTRSGGHDLIVHPDEVGSVADAFRQLAIECKRYQTATDAQIQKWWAQAVTQADDAGLIPVLAYRANRSPWRVVVPLSLINESMCQSKQFEYTSTTTVEAFCSVLRESSADSCRLELSGDSQPVKAALMGPSGELPVRVIRTPTLV